MITNYIRSFPKVIRIEPSGSCNLKCSHCPTGTVLMRRGHMQPATFARILDDIKQNVSSVNVVVLYHGGEPLLNKHFCEMVTEIKDVDHFFVKTVSNGMLLSNSLIEKLLFSRLDSIEFSLDGLSAEENNLVRRNCDFSTVVANIKRLIDYKRKQQVTLPEIFLSTTQFLTDKILRTKPVPIPEYLVHEFSGYMNEISDIKCTLAMRWPHMEVPKELYDIYQDPEDIEIRNYCDHVENTMTIRWNGDVVPCCYDLTSRCVLGNIYQNSLSEIWNNEAYQDLRRSIDKMEFVPLCNNCNVVKPNVFLVPKFREVVFTK